MLEDVYFIPLLDMKNDLFKRDIPFHLQLLVLAGIPIVRLHVLRMIYQTCV
jgi:hypothetical protein